MLRFDNMPCSRFSRFLCYIAPLDGFVSDGTTEALGDERSDQRVLVQRVPGQIMTAFCRGAEGWWTGS